MQLHFNPESSCLTKGGEHAILYLSFLDLLAGDVHLNPGLPLSVSRGSGFDLLASIPAQLPWQDGWTEFCNWARPLPEGLSRSSHSERTGCVWSFPMEDPVTSCNPGTSFMGNCTRRWASRLWKWLDPIHSLTIADYTTKIMEEAKLEKDLKLSCALTIRLTLTQTVK